MPVVYDFGSTEFDDAVRAATRRAFAETLGAGLLVNIKLRGKLLEAVGKRRGHYGSQPTRGAA